MTASRQPLQSSASSLFVSPPERIAAGTLLVSLRVLAILAGLLEAVGSRFYMNVDGISYLDLANAYLHRDWAAAINGWWSPFYSWLLGLFLGLINPSPYWESTVVHAVNFGVYLFALAAFEFLMRALVRFAQTTESATDQWQRLPDSAWWVIGYALFLHASLYQISIRIVTPDLCLSAFIYLAAGILLRIRAGASGWGYYGALGLVLGIAYLTKAALFPLAFVFLLVSVFAAGTLRKGVPRALIALVVFVVVAAPYVVLLSTAKDHFTFGDSGRIAYAQFVNGLTRFGHWQGEGNLGTPKHPVRKVLNHPPVFEFGTPIAGTYPPWYDASYWLDGLEPQFDLRGQVRALRENFLAYVEMTSAQLELVVALLALFFAGRNTRAFLTAFKRQYVLWLPAAAAMIMYSLVLVESRYVAAFGVLFAAALFSAVRLPRLPASNFIVHALVLALLAILCLRVGKTVASDLFHTLRPLQHVQWQVAQGLQGQGIQPGDRVATIIDHRIGDYWAHLAGARIVAEVPYDESAGFWGSSPEAVQAVMQTFARSGAKAAVTNSIPRHLNAQGWQKIGQTDYSFFLLPAPEELGLGGIANLRADECQKMEVRDGGCRQPPTDSGNR